MRYAAQARECARRIDKAIADGDVVDLRAMRDEADRLAELAHVVSGVEELACPDDRHRGELLGAIAEIVSSLVAAHRVSPLVWCLIEQAIRNHAAALDELEAKLPASWHQPAPGGAGA